MGILLGLGGSNARIPGVIYTATDCPRGRGNLSLAVSIVNENIDGKGKIEEYQCLL
jgi:hypothetical protein